ncbi:type II toxin-antitoxin system VapC family toxin [Mycolicibacter icosiumassiliensis]|uniref:type II toxin-antitoxin system VapC family toxin n=1 Tax=Mycolicibacter icosiumassiliensis TaxID=1792835 RepID=UPI000831DF5C|nr:type II toxin-antitoxin system VapC family toxin [Mycolicibacter icosiumassiliensis]
MAVTYLLDTHAVLWALTAPARLGGNARKVLTDRSAPIVVSTVSAWELSTKQRLGKLPQADAILGAYSRHLDRLGASRLPITEEHALLAGRLDWDHRDPFDRMLAAQAIIESMTLITGDAGFAGLPGVPMLW